MGKALWVECLEAALYAWTKVRPLPRNRKPHGLPAPLILSFTSYPARFGTLAAALRSLLAQSIAPDELILWVAHDDWSKLPSNVLDLQERGVTLRATEDLGPYSKIIPTLEFYPHAFIAIADDDIFYDDSWLEILVAGYAGDPDEIVCRRAEKIKLDENGQPLSFLQWELNTDSQERSPLIAPAGGFGALFPPACLHEDVTRRDIFTELAPNADDLWLYWMARLNNCCFRRVGPRPHMLTWPKSQRHSLWSKNQLPVGGNDDQIAKLTAKYGFPFS